MAAVTVRVEELPVVMLAGEAAIVTVGATAGVLGGGEVGGGVGVAVPEPQEVMLNKAISPTPISGT